MRSWSAKARRTTSGCSSSGSTTGDSAAKTWNESTSRATIPSTNVCPPAATARPVGPGRAVPGPRETPPPRPEQYGAVPHIDSGILPHMPLHMPLDRAKAWNPPVYRPRHGRAARWGGSTGRIRAPYMCTRPPRVAPHISPCRRLRTFRLPVAPTRANVDGRRLPAAATTRRDLAHDPARDRLDHHPR